MAEKYEGPPCGAKRISGCTYSETMSGRKEVMFSALWAAQALLGVCVLGYV